MEYCRAAPLKDGELTRPLEPVAAPGVPGSLFHAHPGRVWMLFACTTPEGGAELEGTTLTMTSETPAAPLDPQHLTCRVCWPFPAMTMTLKDVGTRVVEP